MKYSYINPNETTACPYCGQNKPLYTIKKSAPGQFHCAVECKNCYAVGPRVLYDTGKTQSAVSYSTRQEVEQNSKLKDTAIRLWNTRETFITTK